MTRESGNSSDIGTRAHSIHLGEAAGEIFRVVEAHTVGYFGDVAVGLVVGQQFAGHAQTIVANKLPEGHTGLCIKVLVDQRTAHPDELAKLFNTEIGVHVVLFQYLHRTVDKGFAQLAGHLLLVSLHTLGIAVLVFHLIIEYVVYAPAKLFGVFRLLKYLANGPHQSFRLQSSQLICATVVETDGDNYGQTEQKKHKPPTLVEIRLHGHI